LEIIPTADASISLSETQHITNELRKQAALILPQDSFTVLTRDNLISLLPQDDQEADRLIESGVTGIGKAIGAGYVTQGYIKVFDKMLSLTVELYEAETGRLIGNVVVEAENAMELLKLVREASPAMFAKMDNSTPVVLEPEPEPVPEPVPEPTLFEKIKIGIRAGFNLYMYNDDSPGYDAGKGFGGGLRVRIPFAKRVVFNPGVDFYYRELFSFSFEGGEGSMSELSLSVPVCFEFMLAEAFYLLAGPQLDIPFKSELKHNGETYDSGRASFDIALAFGFGYMIMPSLSADLRAVMNVTPVFSGSGDYDKKYGALVQLGAGASYFF
jgi:hypothetical protein